MSVKDELRFWSKVNITSDNGCWEWKNYRDNFGYGTIWWKGKPRLAHRVAYEISNGDIDNNLLVCHRCDNPKCCNPDHLFLGTNKDNVIDRNKKGRQARPKGESNSQSKLTWEIAGEIRRRYQSGGVSQRSLASEYGVNQSQVYRIVNNLRWISGEHEADAYAVALAASKKVVVHK